MNEETPMMELLARVDKLERSMATLAAGLLDIRTNCKVKRRKSVIKTLATRKTKAKAKVKAKAKAKNTDGKPWYDLS
jgi:hypothetical protein